MQVFKRECIGSHCPGVEWPEPLGWVDLGEPFLVETEQCNRANGPITVGGVTAGDAIAIRIEAIEILPPFFAPNGGPFVEGMGEPVALEYADGMFHFPHGLRLKANPSVGNLAVLPKPTERVMNHARCDRGRRGWGWRGVVNDLRAKHSHQDCPYLTAGATLHIKTQVEGAGVCVSDVHGYMGHGELAFAGIEVAANVQLRVERSQGWLVDWPLIETQDEIMLYCSDLNLMRAREDQQYVDVVREAYRAMREVVAAKINGTISDANPIVATALDIRNCAL
jgi:acetamidase/formamidase